MFAGHLGAGLLLKQLDRRLSLALLFTGAMLSDLLLWLADAFIIPPECWDFRGATIATSPRRAPVRETGLPQLRPRA